MLGYSPFPIIPSFMQVGDNLLAFPSAREQPFTSKTPTSIVYQGEDLLMIGPLLEALATHRISASFLLASTRQPETWTMPALTKTEDIGHLEAFQKCIAALRAAPQTPDVAP